MKKTHWLRNTLIVLIICGLAGTILAAVSYSRDGGRTLASAHIQFSFNGSAEGKAPNGYPFDVTGFVSDEVLNNALAASGLADKYTAEDLRPNITVSGEYPEKIVEQMTKYVSLLDSKAENQAVVTDYHATQFVVKLYNDFDTGISQANLTGLLNEIVSAYRQYFAKTYAVNVEEEDAIANLSEYDYAQQLETLMQSTEQLGRHADELAETAPDFKSNGKNFSDISMRYRSLQSDINRLNAIVTFNAVSKDPKRLQQHYETEIRTQNYQLESLTEELKRIEEQVNSYDKDGKIYISSNNSVKEIMSDKDGTYDKLAAKRKEVADKVTATNATITLFQGRLDDMTGVSAREAQQAEGEEDAAAAEQLNSAEKAELQEEVAKRIETLVAKKNAVTADFSAMVDAYMAQEISDRTVTVTAAKYSTPSLFSAAFAVKALMTAGPLCAAGFIVCVVLLIISRRKEEKGLKAGNASSAA